MRTNDNGDEQLDAVLDATLDGAISALLCQQPNESALAYSALLRYLRLGVRRSIRQVAQDGEHDERAEERWSSRYGWARRAAYFDSLRARAQLRDMLKEVA